MRGVPIALQSLGTELHGVLRLPHGPGPHPAVVLIHGSLEQDRDGNMLRDREGRSPPPHPFFRELGVRLSAAGYATVSWDKRGFCSSGTDPGSYWDQATDAETALDLLVERRDIDRQRLFVFGQSAGVFVASILAGRDDRPRAYVLSGGLGSSFKNMMRINCGRLARYAATSEEHRAWVEANAPQAMLVAANLHRLFEAVDAGMNNVRLVYGDQVYDYPIDPRPWDETVHARTVRNVTAPVLVIHGASDLNVPLADADLLVRALRDAGNAHVTQIAVDDADHSFQEVAPTEEQRVRERLSLESFKRPYRDGYFDHVAAFLRAWS